MFLIMNIILKHLSPYFAYCICNVKKCKFEKLVFRRVLKSFKKFWQFFLLEILYIYVRIKNNIKRREYDKSINFYAGRIFRQN